MERRFYHKSRTIPTSGYVGYTKNEQGALKMFKAGLSGRLNIHIINNSLTLPNALKGWIEDACQ